MNEIFKAFDRNNDGILSKDELIQGYAEMYGSHQRACVEVDIILNKLDLNGSGEVDYSGKTIFEKYSLSFRILIISDKHSRDANHREA